MRPAAVDMQLALHAVAGRKLKAMDRGGTSDPYITFQVLNRKETCQTRVMSKNLNPEWNETFVLTASSRDVLSICVWDKDLIGSDDLIGSFVIPLSSITCDGEATNAPPTSQWYTIRDKSQTLTGEISLSMRFTPLPSQDRMMKADLAIQAVRARGLTAMDRSGTSDPYTTFRIEPSPNTAQVDIFSKVSLLHIYCTKWL